METILEEGEEMEEQMTLFEVRDSYNLLNLKKICRDEVKKKFPNPIPDEDYSDYLEFLDEETDLLFSQRLREIADEIENRIFGKQREEIAEIYGKNEKK